MAEGKEGRATELGSDGPSPTRPESPKQGGRGGRSREAARGGAGVGQGWWLPTCAPRGLRKSILRPPGGARAPLLSALHQIPLANLIRCLGPDSSGSQPLCDHSLAIQGIVSGQRGLG